MLQAIQDCLSPFCSAGSVLCCLNHRHCKALMEICKPGSRLGLQLAALIKVLFDLKFHNTPVAEPLLIFSLEALFETEFKLCNESIGEVKIGNSKVICSIPNSVVPLRFTLCLDVEWEIAIRPIRLANQPIPGWCPFLKDWIAVSKYASPQGYL